MKSRLLWIWQKRTLLVLAMMVCMAVVSLKPGYRIDKVWSDFNLVSEAKTIPSDFLLVEVTTRDLNHYGGPPLPREVLADVLHHLADAEVARVLLDFAFVTDLTPDTDQALSDAFERLGAQRVAIGAGLGADQRTLRKFAEQATLINLRLLPDRDGRIRSIRYRESEDVYNPARWLAMGETYNGQTPLDLRYEPGSVERVSVSDLLARSPSDLRGRRVVISTHRDISFSTATLPFNGVSGRGEILTLAAMSEASGFPSRHALIKRVSWGLLVLFGLLGLVTGYRAENFKILLSALFAVIVSSTALSSLLLSQFGVATEPSLYLLVYWSCILVALIGRFQIMALFNTFIRGDLTPEEAWLWSSSVDRPEPVILFGSNGETKRANRAAVELDVSSFRIAAKIMPRLGVRETRLNLSDQSPETSRTYQVDWPHESLSLVVLTDITERTQKEERLVSELRTDSLTQLLNKRGFEELLEACAETADQAYTVFYIDMNGFKAVNDNFGHDVGDELLKVAAKRFLNTARGCDHVGRLGGDEFAVLSPQIMSSEQMQIMADRLEQSLAGPINLALGPVHVGAAVGYSAPRFPQEDVSDVVRRADQMMYERKRSLKAHLSVA